MPEWATPVRLEADGRRRARAGACARCTNTYARGAVEVDPRRDAREPLGEPPRGGRAAGRGTCAATGPPSARSRASRRARTRPPACRAGARSRAASASGRPSPTSDDVGPQLVEVAVEHAVVVARQPRAARAGSAVSNCASRRRQRSSRWTSGPSGSVAPVSRVGREHAHLVAARAQVLDRRVPHQLVAAVVVWRVHVPDGQHPHGG